MRVAKRTWASAAVIVALMSGLAYGQPTQAGGQQNPPPRGQRAGRPGAPPAGVPALRPGADQQAVLEFIDGFMLAQARQQMRLTDEQWATFVVPVTRIQSLRRRQGMERRKLMQELRGLVMGNVPGGDDAIVLKVRALTEADQRLETQLQRAYQELDAGLTPWQRGRFRLLEDMIERRKIELLAKVIGK